MIRTLTLWLIRHTCGICGKATIRRRHFHWSCERAIVGPLP